MLYLIKTIKKIIKTYRIEEVGLIMGFFIVGILFVPISFKDFDFYKLTVYLLAIFFLVFAIYSFNAWAGYKEDSLNQRLQHLNVNKRNNYFVIFGIAAATALLLFYQLSLFHLVLSSCVLTLSFLYSFPIWGLKLKPMAGTVIHFVNQIAHFFMGYALFAEPSSDQFLQAVYFSLLLSAGHLNHEVIDYKADKQSRAYTTAIWLGPKTGLLLSTAFFAVAEVWLFLLLNWGLIDKIALLPFAIAGGISLVFFVVVFSFSLTPTDKVPYMLRTAYRLLFFLAGCTLMLLKIVS